MEREALYHRIDARVDAMFAAGAADEVRRADAAGASPSARQALGFDELLRGDVEGMKRRTRRYAKRQLTWLRKLPGALTIDVSERTAGSWPGGARGPARSAAGHDARMRFEKWQALGNDYLIVEASELAFPLTAVRGPAAVRPPHRPGRRRRARALAAGRAGLRRAPAHLQPGRVRGGAVGQRRARGDHVPAPAGATDQDQFSIQTAAGEIRPTILGPTTCRVDMGRARCSRSTSPAGPPTASARSPGRASSTSRSAIRSARSTSRGSRSSPH